MIQLLVYLAIATALPASTASTQPVITPPSAVRPPVSQPVAPQIAPTPPDLNAGGGGREKSGGISLSDELATIAIVLTIVNVAIAIFQTLKTIRRSVRATHIGSSFSRGVDPRNPLGYIDETTMSVDIVNTGAPLWDFEVRLEMLIPAKYENGRLAPPTQLYLPLQPIVSTDHLNSGQSMGFRLRKSGLGSGFGTDRDEGFKHLVSEMKTVPKRYVSLCIYASNRQVLVKRIRSRKLRWAFQNFFRIKHGAKAPLSSRIEFRLSEFALSKRGNAIRVWVEKQRPGLFDYNFIRLSHLFEARKFKRNGEL